MRTGGERGRESEASQDEEEDELVGGGRLNGDAFGLASTLSLEEDEERGAMEVELTEAARCEGGGRMPSFSHTGLC
jgi:hypothetical protein